MGGGVSGEGAAVVAEARRAADIAIRRKWCHDVVRSRSNPTWKFNYYAKTTHDGWHHASAQGTRL